MTGIGTWKATLSSMLVNGEAEITISDIGGEYGIDIKLPEKFSMVKIDVKEIHAEGNKLLGNGSVELTKGKEIEVTAEIDFDGDSMQGIMKFPKMNGKIKIKDGHRIG